MHIAEVPRRIAQEAFHGKHAPSWAFPMLIATSWWLAGCSSETNSETSRFLSQFPDGMHAPTIQPTVIPDGARDVLSAPGIQLDDFILPVFVSTTVICIAATAHKMRQRFQRPRRRL